MNKHERASVWIIFVIWFVLVLYLANTAYSAEKHDTDSPYHWWSYACCDERDCRAAEEGEVRVTDKGYIITTPDGVEHFLHWKDSRVKKKPADNPYAYDGKDHICIDTKMYKTEWYVRCLYPKLGAF